MHNVCYNIDRYCKQASYTQSSTMMCKKCQHHKREWRSNTNLRFFLYFVLFICTICNVTCFVLYLKCWENNKNKLKQCEENKHFTWWHINRHVCIWRAYNYNASSKKRIKIFFLQSFYFIEFNQLLSLITTKNENNFLSHI